MERTNTKKYADRIIILLSLVIAGILTWIVVQHMEVQAQTRLQEHLAEEVLRFHILANSDSEEDQSLKMAVKEDVLAYLKQEMPEGLNVDETKDWMRRHIDELEQTCRKSVAARGADDPVSAAVTTCWFPEKSYGDVTFPAGNYEALRVEIGAAKGHNWWCVLYPGLCFMDAARAVVPQEGKQELKNVLTEDEYSRITAGTKFKIKWYFLELFQN